MLAALFGVVVFIFGSVSGQEFSPQKFRIRRFSYYQIPLLRLQILPVRFSPVGGTEDALALHVRQNQLNKSVAGSTTEWHVVEMQEAGRATFVGDANILTNYLKQPGAAGTDDWLEWSTEHSDSAELLWDAVARMADKKMYVLIPELMEMARRESTAADLESAISTLLAKELRQFSKAYSETGDGAQADVLAKLAAEYDEVALEE